MRTEIMCGECREPLERLSPDHPRHRFGKTQLVCTSVGCGVAEFDHIVGEDAPLHLDLFCGVGGTGRSLKHALTGGLPDLHDVIGVEVDGSKAEKYDGHFIDHDLSKGLPPTVRQLSFDVAWASPPCQFATTLQFRRSGKNLIPLARRLLERVDASMTVIENVPGAERHMEDPVMMCGSAFGLGVRKHRLFETDFPAESVECDHPDRFEFCIGERESPVTGYREAHGLPRTENLGAKEVRECIPIPYIQELWRQFLESNGVTPPDTAIGVNA